MGCPADVRLRARDELARVAGTVVKKAYSIPVGRGRPRGLPREAWANLLLEVMEAAFVAGFTQGERHATRGLTRR